MTNKDYTPEEIEKLARYFEVNNVAVNEEAEYAARMALDYFSDDLAERDAEIERLKGLLTPDVKRLMAEYHKYTQEEPKP